MCAIEITQQKKKERKKERLLFVMAWMDLEGIMLSELSQTEKEIPYDSTYMWNIKKQSNKQNKTEPDP